MATQVISFTITGTQANLTAALDSFVYQHNYQDTLANGDPNPESKLDFFKRKVREFAKDSIKAYNIRTSADTAKATAAAAVDANLGFT